jgi:hypothetical protein
MKQTVCLGLVFGSLSVLTHLLSRPSLGLRSHIIQVLQGRKGYPLTWGDAGNSCNGNIRQMIYRKQPEGKLHFTQEI